MLAKVNELNKNVVILLSVGIIAITSIIITLITTSDSSKGNPDSLRDFQQYFIAEYGVKPIINVEVNNVSEDQAKEITQELSNKLKLGGIIPVDLEDQKWYSTQRESDISVSAKYNDK
jgi:hypothetical protein